MANAIYKCEFKERFYSLSILHDPLSKEDIIEKD